MISKVKISIESDDEFSFADIKEQYTLGTLNDTILIQANNSFGAIRGLASMAFLPYMSQQHNQDERYYDMKRIEIQDQPMHQFRAYSLDGAGKFVKMETIKKTIDAISL